MQFRTKARAIDLLGKGQIADLPTAIYELWKNGYDAYAKEVSAELSKKLGRRVTLFSGKTGGKIELDYYSDDDREVLIDLLRSLIVRK